MTNANAAAEPSAVAQTAPLVVIDRQGHATEIAGVFGLSVMEIIRDHGFNDLLALCGGCCSCATCHIYVDEQALSMLTPMNSDESELLSMSDARTPQSRLSCQLRFNETLAGLRVTIAPPD